MGFREIKQYNQCMITNNVLKSFPIDHKKSKPTQKSRSKESRQIYSKGQQRTQTVLQHIGV